MSWGLGTWLKSIPVAKHTRLGLRNPSLPPPPPLPPQHKKKGEEEKDVGLRAAQETEGTETAQV